MLCGLRRTAQALAKAAPINGRAYLYRYNYWFQSNATCSAVANCKLHVRDPNLKHSSRYLWRHSNLKHSSRARGHSNLKHSSRARVGTPTSNTPRVLVGTPT